jgi:hypothetical protein
MAVAVVQQGNERNARQRRDEARRVVRETSVALIAAEARRDAMERESRSEDELRRLTAMRDLTGVQLAAAEARIAALNARTALDDAEREFIAALTPSHRDKYRTTVRGFAASVEAAMEAHDALGAAWDAARRDGVRLEHVGWPALTGLNADMSAAVGAWLRHLRRGGWID